MTRRLNQLVPPWLIAFSGCAIAVLGAMGWITHRALTLEIAEAKARAEATRQEAVRLALWRMDSWMTSLIAREAARPYFHYVSFYPTDRPYALYSSEFTIDALSASETVSPSPLLTSPPPDVKLFFQIWPDGHITSPQVPTGGLRGLALLADASGNSIDTASGTLAELSQLLTSGESRRALGAGEQPPRALTSNESLTLLDAMQIPGAPNVGTPPTQEQAKSESGPGGASNNRVAAEGAPRAQQIEMDGKQRWQTSNDYEVRQQVAETTRNLSQNRAPAYQSAAANAAPTAHVQTAATNDPTNAADPKALADAALRKSTGENRANQLEEKDSAKQPDALADRSRSGPEGAESRELNSKDASTDPTSKELAAKKEPGVEGASKLPPGVPTGKQATKEATRESSKEIAKPDRQEDQVRIVSSGAPSTDVKADAKADVKAVDDKAAAPPVTPPATGSSTGSATGSGTHADLANLKLKEAAATATRPTADSAPPAADPSAPGTTRDKSGESGVNNVGKWLDQQDDKQLKDSARRYDRDSFPVVVRSLAVEPTPLITACVAGPQEVLTKPSSPLFAAPTSPAGSTSIFTGNAPSPTSSPTLAPPRDTGTPIVHASVPFNLFLTRQVPLDSGRVVQGMWLDWPMLRSNLLALSQDLLPGATLELCAPMSSSAAAGDGGLMLASIPARLVLPDQPATHISMISLLSGATWTPTRIAIIGGWIAVLGGIFAIGWVLRQSVQLGERRGRFVSAVTHELRTPLTTFALYSQMLADGMVQDPEAQREYHQTLRKESDRLSRIVESVLDYARLGKQRSDANGNTIRPSIGAADLLAALEPHLRSRASVNGLDLILDTPDLANVTLRAERDSIERILENLVENAGKYAAAEGRDNRLHLTATVDGRWLNLDLADHGPGIPANEAKRIFAPFERGKAQQDGSKPGLGLGLAFARGLARDLGGDLILLGSQREFGAIFRLRIPAEIQQQSELRTPESATTEVENDGPVADRPVAAEKPTE